MTKPIKAQEMRKRLRDDFEFYSKHAVKIRTKEGEVISFTLNRVQKKLLKAITEQYERTGKVRVVILKARQQGLSTFVSAWLYFYLSQHSAKKGFVVAHVADSTKTLFDLYKRVHNLVPDLLRPSTKYSSRRELTFDVLDTGLTVATAGGDGIGRSETITHAHLSEVA